MLANIELKANLLYTEDNNKGIQTNTKGFTLIKLLTVIVILVLVSAYLFLV